jgi:hypothetical protein
MKQSGWALRWSPRAEQAKHVGDEEINRMGPQSYTNLATWTPAGMAVVTLHSRQTPTTK